MFRADLQTATFIGITLRQSEAEMHVFHLQLTASRLIIWVIDNSTRTSYYRNAIGHVRH